MVDCSGFIQPLDLECIFTKYLGGSMETFIIMALIGIAILGASLRMLNIIVLLSFALFAVIMGNYLGEIFFVVVLIVGILAAYIIGGIIKR